MAICEYCKQEMLTADSCVGAYLVIKGKYYRRIRMGEPRDMYQYLDPKEDKKARCGDCGVRIGKIHHFGCDCEACPICGRQLISCDCLRGDCYIADKKKAREKK